MGTKRRNTKYLIGSGMLIFQQNQLAIYFSTRVYAISFSCTSGGGTITLLLLHA